jgi:hypothetical protein
MAYQACQEPRTGLLLFESFIRAVLCVDATIVVMVLYKADSTAGGRGKVKLKHEFEANFTIAVVDTFTDVPPPRAVTSCWIIRNDLGVVSVILVGNEDSARFGVVINDFNPIRPFICDNLVPVQFKRDVPVTVAVVPVIWRNPVYKEPACVENALVIDQLWAPSEMMAKAFGMWVTWSTWLNGWQSWFTQLVVLGVPTRYSLQGIVA